MKKTTKKEVKKVYKVGEIIKLKHDNEGNWDSIEEWNGKFSHIEHENYILTVEVKAVEKAQIVLSNVVSKKK